MPDFVPVVSMFGINNQATQRSSISLDLDNLNLYFYYTFSKYVYNAYPSAVYSKPNVPINIATYNGQEYVYFGAGPTSGSIPTNFLAIKVTLGQALPTYDIITTTLLAGDTNVNKIRSTIVTSATAQIYILAYSSCRAYSQYEMFRVTPPPIGSTNGTLAPFSDASFAGYNHFDGKHASSGNILTLGNKCYIATTKLTQFDPDFVSAPATAKSTTFLVYSANNVGLFIVADSRAIAGSYNIYIATGVYNYRFNTSDISTSLPNPIAEYRDGGGVAYWAGECRGLVFKDAVNEADRRLYSVVGLDQATLQQGLVSYNKNYQPLDSLLFPSDKSFCGPALGADGTIYVRAYATLYAIQDSGLSSSSETVPNGSLSIKYTYVGLPSGGEAVSLRHTATPIIDGSGRIIVCSNAVGTDNVHIFTDTGTELRLDKSFEVPDRIYNTPSIGSTGLLYILAGIQTLYVYGLTYTPTTTTTTTTAPIVTTTTTSSSTTTATTTATTTTLIPTTTTTTTLLRGIEKGTMAISQADGKFILAEYTSNVATVSSTGNITSTSSQGNAFSVIYQTNLSSPADKILYNDCNDKVYISTRDNVYSYAISHYVNSNDVVPTNVVSNTEGNLISAYKCNNDSIWSVQSYNNKVVKMDPDTFLVTQEYSNLDAPFKVKYSEYHRMYFVAGSHMLWQINDSTQEVNVVYRVNDYVIKDLDISENGAVCILLSGDTDSYIRILNKNLYNFLLNQKVDSSENLRYCKYCQEGRFYILSELDTITMVYSTIHYLFNANNGKLDKISSSNAAIVTTTTTTLPVVSKAVLVQSPVGGEQIPLGGSYEVKWASSKSASDLVNIDLYKQDIFYSSIVEKTQNSGVYGWNVDKDIKDDTNYKLKVTWISASSNPDNYDMSADFFSITLNPTTTTTTTTSSLVTQSAIAIDYSSISNQIVVMLKSGAIMTFDLSTLVVDGLIYLGIKEPSTMSLKDVVINGIDRQTKVRIFVGSAPNLSDKWDSGEVETSLTSMYYGGGNNLQTGVEYFVHIQTCSQQNGWGDVQMSSFIMTE